MVFKHLYICVVLFQLSFNYISNAILYDLHILATFGSICYSMFIKKKKKKKGYSMKLIYIYIYIYFILILDLIVP